MAVKAGSVMGRPYQMWTGLSDPLTKRQFRAKPAGMRRAFLISAVTLLALAGLAAPAEAAFNVCNKTDLATRVALGRFDGSHWTSEGWWTVKPRTCAGLITGPLDSRYYYLYATDSAAVKWPRNRPA